MTVEEQKRLKAREKQLNDLVHDLETGNVHPEDLDDELIAKLETLLKKRG
jgi:hypothetical protein